MGSLLVLDACGKALGRPTKGDRIGVDFICYTDNSVDYIYTYIYSWAQLKFLFNEFKQ